MTDSSHTILQSAKRFFSGTLLSRITGMLRDMAMAYAFGTQSAIASFMVAYRLAHLCRRLFGEGSLQAAFIPEFETLRHQNSQRAFTFFRDLMATLTLFLVLLISLVCLGLGIFLMWGDPQPANRDILVLTMLMLPSLLFICLFGLNASLLQCEKSYFTPGVAPVAFNLIWIIAVWMLKPYAASEAMPLLSIGVIVACFFQWVLTVPKTWKLLKQQLSGYVWNKIDLFSADVFHMGKPFILGLTGVMASQINAAMDSLFARYAEAEGPAMLWYAIRLQQLPLALFSVAIAGALLPPLTRALKAHDWGRYYSFLNEALAHTCTLMIPLTAALFAIGDSSVNLIFGHGDFSNSSVLGTTLCLWAYGIGLLPTSLILLLAPACYAQSNYRLPAIASCLNMLLNLILNAFFINGFGWGAMSVALATSVSAWVNAIFLGRSLTALNGPWISKNVWQHIWKLSIAALIALMGTDLYRNHFYLSALSLVWNQAPHFPRSLSEQFTILISQCACFGFLLLGCIWLLGINIRQPLAIKAHKQITE
ncbi:hypothetical protein PNK_0392 [Candidatus Protochlamydia naegleriophila]|uniref:Lipid II flippase n=1 Tax=Candidatus Protochlamydia naegleriophila TaxID=389348 RepID=A0A0U5J8D1_9BACT|nr:murein biosynthesis integral membrane protein MurJ [Candidatus Protochlamydia naegleriophila]CUI16024.1 hypothetical protein PNK_0392 [Candidatus Protochlamydia naegleriophila]